MRAMRPHVLLFAMTVMLAAAAALVAALVEPAAAQQVPDTLFDTSIARPMWAEGSGPRLVLDQAHFNFHTLAGRYRPFGDLARHDGFRVGAGTAAFTRESLTACDLLVIANAAGELDLGGANAEHDAFTPDECAAVRAWVEKGGALLLIADHAPFGAATASLARALGVDLRNSYTADPRRGAKGSEMNPVYEPGAGLDTTHAIVRGRDASERVRRVKAFTGESVAGPPGAVSICALSDEAYDIRMSFVEFQRARGKVPKDARVPASGRAQLIAFALGKGRVVVAGEAAMFTAQLAGPGGEYQMGMNEPGLDNRQFATNVLRWLAKKL